MLNLGLIARETGIWFKNCMSDSEYNLMNQMPISECHLPKYIRPCYHKLIIESVDSISRDGPDAPIYVIHYKSLKNSALVNYQDFKLTQS